MATLRCQVYWDPNTNKVVKTFDVLPGGLKDKVQFITPDSTPFIIQTKNERLAKWLGLQKAKNADGRSDLYQVKKAPPPSPKGHPPVKKTTLQHGGKAPKPPLPCGTLVAGKYVAWGGAGLGPDK
jgi:hypothetical protein